MDVLDIAREVEKERQKQQIINYYEERLDEALGIFWSLTDNPYRRGTEMTEEEIKRMKKFLHEFKYQKGGGYA